MKFTATKETEMNSQDHPFVVEHERRIKEEGFFYGFSDDSLLESLIHWQGIYAKYPVGIAREQVKKLETELARRTA